MWDERPSIVLLLNTFRTREAIGSRLAGWVERIRRMLFEPFLLAAPIARKARVDSPQRVYTGTPPWGPPGEVKMYMSVYGRKESPPNSREVTEGVWREALARIRSGSLGELQLYLDRLGEDGFPDSDLGGASLDLTLPAGGGSDACELALVMDARMFGPAVPLSVQGSFVDLLKDGALALDASTGFITLDANGSPYESRYGLRETEGRRGSADRLRGYYWANVLSRGHTGTLGGMDRIRAEAPCHIAEDLSSGHGTMAYLQLTPDLNGFDDEALRSLRDYLWPVLIPPRRRDGYIGPRLRIIE